MIVGNRSSLLHLLSVQVILKSTIKGFGGDHNITIHSEYRRRLDLSLAFSDCVFEEFESWKFACLGKPNGVNVFITSDNHVSIINPDDLSVSARVNIEYGELKIKNIGIDEIPISEDRVSREMQFSIILDHVSLGQDVVMIFPIIPSLCLIGFSDSERHARFINVPKNDIRTIGFLNLITFNQCNKAVYSHSKEHLENSKTNMHKFLDYCKQHNFVPSFDIGIR